MQYRNRSPFLVLQNFAHYPRNHNKWYLLRIKRCAAALPAFSHLVCTVSKPAFYQMSALQSISIQAYADDVLISTTSKHASLNVIKLQTFLPELEKWAKDYKIQIAHLKTEIKHFLQKEPIIKMWSWISAEIRSLHVINLDSMLSGLTLSFSGPLIWNILHKRLPTGQVI